MRRGLASIVVALSLPLLLSLAGCRLILLPILVTGVAVEGAAGDLKLAGTNFGSRLIVAVRDLKVYEDNLNVKTTVPKGQIFRVTRTNAYREIESGVRAYALGRRVGSNDAPTLRVMWGIRPDTKPHYPQLLGPMYPNAEQDWEVVPLAVENEEQLRAFEAAEAAASPTDLVHRLDDPDWAVVARALERLRRLPPPGDDAIRRVEALKASPPHTLVELRAGWTLDAWRPAMPATRPSPSP